MSAKKTPFYDIHVALKAKIVPFAGYLMPVMYDSINAEHLRVRNAVGMFDISHMGEFELTGPGARTFVQKLVTNDLDKLVENQVMYTCMCLENGGIVDDLLVYNLPDRIMLVVNAANIDKDFAHIKKYLPADVKLIDRSAATALIAIQGPLAQGIVAKFTAYPLADIKYYHAATAAIAGEKILFSRTGYTGEDGFELYIPAEKAVPIWEALYSEVVKVGGSAIGLGARDSLRLEMKFALYGNDISADTNPLEAGLGWVVKLDKGEFIGSRALAEVKKNGLPRKLIGFVIEGQAFPRQHYPIFHDGSKVGEVTSGIFSPSLKKGIGMGYVPTELAGVGGRLEIDIRGKKHEAMIIKPPFYKRNNPN